MKSWQNLRDPLRVRHPYLVNGAFFVVGLLLGILCLTFFKAGQIYDYQDTFDGAQLPEVDAIVVLAGGKGRISAGGDFWYRFYEAEQAGEGRIRAPILYISGMGHKSDWNTFSRQVRRGVLQVMKPQDVVLETESADTIENAEWLVKYAQLKGWKKIILMTSPYHMRRSRFIFTQVFKSSNARIAFETYSIIQEPFSQEEWRESLLGIRVTIFEYVKWLYYTSFWEATPVGVTGNS